MAGSAEGKKGGVLQGRYEMGRVLGHGNFGRVHIARDLRTGRAVAVKVVAKDKVVRAGMVEQIKREIAVMKRVSHPNIVELHEVMATRSKIYLALELVRGGELFARIERSGRVTEDIARRYFRQLISAVDFCHARGVYHRDLKPENLLLDEAGNLKVVDFGLSALADHARADGLLHTLCGTPGYAAPEVLRDKGYDGAKADLWSCGVILYVLLAGSLPFPDDNVVTMYKKAQRGDYRCPPWFSTDARRLIPKLLDPDPATRITVAQLVETSWFKKTSIAKPLSLEPPACVKDAADKDEPEALNAFHLISLSEGFDLSPLFEGHPASRRREGGMRFATREPARGVVSRLEEVAARGGGRMRVTKSSPGGVRLEGAERGGRKGRLAVAAEIFSVAPSVLVVDVKKDGGDTLEYLSFCCDELRPALQDIVWAADPPASVAIAV
ncbi:CBL-interacting protein kinase 6 [Aegilops tauschii subsp. strangulata]|uniref:non-specific serine/threonine protein kinase n=2 Tax=Triticinae TaxID=1648030 RepID=A0A453HMS4_AEGTS|nr:CBL-interacting protein kinase 6 [Aegilops tauschii subsp. strangulata]XP_044377753.1 CBL-interacting protein kinase 6-like [Triticum aestivum]